MEAVMIYPMTLTAALAGALCLCMAPFPRAESFSAGPEKREDLAVIRAQMPGQILASALIDTPVMAAGGESVGHVSDLLLTGDGQIVGVLVSIGGILGMGAKNVAVPWSRLVAYADNKQVDVLAVQLSNHLLDAAPAFETRETQSPASSLVRMQMPASIEPAAGPPAIERAE